MNKSVLFILAGVFIISMSEVSAAHSRLRKNPEAIDTFNLFKLLGLALPKYKTPITTDNKIISPWDNYEPTTIPTWVINNMGQKGNKNKA